MVIMRRIERIILKNFRQYKDLDLTFSKDEANDLHLIVGDNGMGKTTFLNAINWCLYGEEPHSSEKSSKLPLINLNSIENTKDDFISVVVEVWITDQFNDYMVFQRKQTFRIDHKRKLPIPQNNEFIVTYHDSKGNAKILEDAEAELVSQRFVPSAIREFFFFDGERLDNFFEKKDGDKVDRIKNNIFTISHIFLLDNMENRLIKMKNEFRRTAGKLNPKIDEKRKELDIAKNNLEDIESELNNTKRQIDLANKEIQDYEAKLKNSSDATTLDARRKKHIKNKNELEKKLEEKTELKKLFLQDSAKIIYLWPAIKNSINCIEDKKRKNEIPPTIDKSLLEKILLDNNCDICGRHLEDNSRIRVESLLKKVNLSTEIVRELHSMENPLLNYKEKVLNFMETRKNIQKDIQYYENQIKIEETEIDTLNKQLSGINVDQIREWHEERLKLENANKTNYIKMGSLKTQIVSLKNRINKLKNEEKKLVNQEDKAEKIKQKLAFTEAALSVIEKTKDSIMIETKKFIESETRRIFFALLWKTATFKDVTIDEEYNINLIHNSGFDCLGTASAAEKELLALSFTLALHNVTGFDCPILIDTPVARVSGKHRENFAKIFLKVSENKQIILLFTPAEFSEDIKSIFDGNIINKYKINMISDEKEAKIEVS